MCILFVYIYILLKVISYYDLRVLSMSVMSLKKIGWEVGGWSELYPSLIWIFGIFYFAKPLGPDVMM